MKKNIIKKAYELFQNQGYAQTSTSQISQEVGVAKGTFYHHFSSKDKLLVETINYCNANLDAEIQNLKNISSNIELDEFINSISNSPELIFLIKMSWENSKSPKVINIIKNQLDILNSEIISFYKINLLESITMNPAQFANLVESIIFKKIFNTITARAGEDLSVGSILESVTYKEIEGITGEINQDAAIENTDIVEAEPEEEVDESTVFIPDE